MNRIFVPLFALSALACGDPTPSDSNLSFGNDSEATLRNGLRTSFTVNGVESDQAYRVTLVHADNIDVSGSTAVFVDDDSNGAADAGPSEDVGGLYSIQGTPLDALAKTFPSGDDDPADPSAIFGTDGSFTFEIEGVAPGAFFPVVYRNGGASTFLEIDADGVPVEDYVVGPMIRVEAPEVTPGIAGTVSAGSTIDYTVSGLDDNTPYRVTLVVAGNVDITSEFDLAFTDSGSGTASAGASEETALITMANGIAFDTGSKTVPSPDDDPSNPSGLFPQGGELTFQVEGVSTGIVVPVIYRNGGDSTFLEIDANGRPVEEFAVGGALTVLP